MSQIQFIPDQQQRLTAIDPTRSFILQAPAGSGKTELITQRYLALLARVQNAPEEIIALTFTRKAANEMQERIINALQAAQMNTPTNSPHQQKTRELAQAVLQRDQQEQWHLLENPHRLRIQTIDALCLSLVQQMPILSQFGSTPTIIEDANPLYIEAVRDILNNLEEQENWSEALEEILFHLDNQQYKAEQLLVDMLARRDQWLPHLIGTDTQVLLNILEKSLQNIVLENIEKLSNALPHALTKEFILLTQFAANNLKSLNSKSPIVSCANLTDLPAIQLELLPQWLGIATLFLTKDHDWRKKITENEGFPAPSKIKDKNEKLFYESHKKRMQELLAQLQNETSLKILFADLLSLPPTHYSETQTSIIKSLITLLPVLVAQLRIVFAQKGMVDYCEITLRALQALGETEAPTDLALALDYRIQHILVDEFQDTSISQFHLLEKLTAGWQENDGRTLFLVGDPMQSIYRFRKAEVGLFLRARNDGIGNIHLEPLTLRANFRSDPKLVEWTNKIFSQVFPKYDDISCGAIRFSHSSSAKSALATSAIKIHAIDNQYNSLEGKTIVDIILETKIIKPDASIAILVRSRQQLLNIIPALQAAQLPYQAVEIELLSQKSIILDLLALTRALLHLADRTAWLAVLRAPWCGLSLADLHALTFNDSTNTIWQLLNNPEIQTRISDAGKIHLARLINVFSNAFQERRKKSLRYWIEGVWLALGGPACLNNDSEFENVLTFFNLLDNLTIGNDISDISLLEKKLNNLTASPNQIDKPCIEIMTIHKAKGLEFDAVILAGLDRNVRADDKQLLLWMERAGEHRHDDLILAPIKATMADHDAIYDYVRREEHKKSLYETQRLLYVAATRAKYQLHLVFHYEQNENSNDGIRAPNSQSLLAQLWPYFSLDEITRIQDNNQQTNEINENQFALINYPLKRLKKFKIL